MGGGPLRLNHVWLLQNVYVTGGCAQLPGLTVSPLPQGVGGGRPSTAESRLVVTEHLRDGWLCPAARADCVTTSTRRGGGGGLGGGQLPGLCHHLHRAGGPSTAESRLVVTEQNVYVTGGCAQLPGLTVTTSTERGGQGGRGPSTTESRLVVTEHLRDGRVCPAARAA